MTGPDLKGTIDDHRYGGGLCFSGDQFETTFDGADSAVMGSSSFGKENYGPAFAETIDNGPDGSEIGLSALDGEGVQRANIPGEITVSKQTVSGDIIKFPVESHSAEHGIEKALVVA